MKLSKRLKETIAGCVITGAFFTGVETIEWHDRGIRSKVEDIIKAEYVLEYQPSIPRVKEILGGELPLQYGLERITDNRTGEIFPCSYEQLCEKVRVENGIESPWSPLFYY